VSSIHVSNDRRSDSHWASLPESGSTAWLWIGYLSYVWIGRPLFRLLVWPASWYFVTVRPVARRASIEYQRRIGVLAADSSAWQAWRAAAVHVRHFADTLLDKALVWTGGLALDGIRREVDSRFDDAVDENRGGVLVVAHFGNLEVLRRLGERAKQLRLHILVHTRHAERFNRMLTRMNPQSAERLLQVTEVDTATIAHLAARVELGDFVVIAADRVPVTRERGSDGRRAAPSASRAPAGGERVIDVPFLGANAAFPIGPWVLAAALGCPVYWLACYQRPADRGRYTLVCELMRERIVLPRKVRDAALREVIADYVRYLERACREAPLAWFNFFPFWRTSR
jgi:predicted LPLAT superfamily acyltransferase